MQIRRRPPTSAVEMGSLRYEVALPNSKPQNILEEIVWYKEKEVDSLRDKQPLIELKKKINSMSAPLDFLAILSTGKTQPAVIAEVKKASPSKGIIREDFEPVAIAKAYQQNGATCISVLTDKKFFQGSFEYLSNIRKNVDLPLLCKDFLIYPYQIYLARLYGADAVLLIAAILSDQDLKYFIKIVNTLGMTPLVEVHSLTELDRVLTIEGVKLVGINNRNLEDFSVDLQTTYKLMEARKKELEKLGILVVSESGIHEYQDVNVVKNAGVDAVLIGESLMKKADPGAALLQLFT
ncbi:MAG: indole-3-glycerol phosphate synthase TrpC [Okeania sp. SIO2G4]|uniref:indole-3-glycerol phosphate synthase TrpC n=1 Tax=unclassified Okeania TaxID=2634635 RepID=UPI0013BD5A66|nr:MULTISPECIES: indole-3-glycerol phosphate synthase TrpC [unclassified Okeania]NEP37793.1 indole-3-glycerol phosphate synthase TrpC [Okeania sp. SIO2H7]NEP71751.1 indole-3-glycerol phosphate synthase TrpC [Okeania sp. SIO2G5]NEP92477.1 indole-3-glycerol phosphate synthase TrpC [Okeania sp. SIO2F5]NEQ90451.1 indole-3-glycerol phosphate synthase TrpC [Okeania sp. SIO2G4]